MKTRITFGIVLSTLMFFAASALYAQFGAGQYSRTESGNIIQQFPLASSTDATYGVPSYPLYRPVLESGQGRQEVEVYCSRCHSPNYITMQPPLPADTWAAEVNKMEKTYGADIPDEITQKVIHYLQAHYTPETRKH
jgi:hypothetical protein